MRIFATIFAVLVGISVACAQGDPRESYGPQTAAAAPAAATKPKPARAAKPAPPASRQAEPAKPKSNSEPRREAAKPKQQTATRAPSAIEKPAAKPAITDQALRDSYAAIPVADRIALQSDLIWTGDYDGAINGEVSERLIEAVQSYQKRHKAKATGLLNPNERGALRAMARPRQDEVGWRMTEDPATGARIGLPLKLVTKREPAPSGTRWSSQQGQLQIETFRIDTGATLEGVFEQQKKDPPQRRATSNLLRDKFFVVSGTQGLKKFYVRGFAQNGEVRGITILYDQAEAHMDSMVVAMAGAFAPFSTYEVAAVAGSSRRRVDYATGLVVSQSGHIVTARQAVEGCRVIVIPRLGNAEQVAAQTDGELALIRVYGARTLAPISFAAAALPGGAVTLVGIAEPEAQGGGAAVTTATAKVGTGAPRLPLDPPPVPGFSGAAALDGNAELIGTVVLKPAAVAGASSAPQAAIVPVQAIRDFLEANGVAPASGSHSIEHAKAAVVRVICVRQ